MRFQDLAPLGIIFVITGIALGVGAEVLDSMKTAEATTSSVTNETVTVTSGTGLVTGSLANSATGVTSPTACSNVTQIWAVPTCCNVSSTDSRLLQVCDTDQPTVNVTYGYYVINTFWTSTTNASLGIGKLAKWFPTIGLVVAAAIVIGLTVSAFGRKSAAGV